MFEGIKEIVESILGSPRRDNEGWREYNCVYCALEKGVESDGKYNMAVNYGEDMKTKPHFHCWRCGTAGKLSKLLKDFGTNDSLVKYNKELKNIRSSFLYNIEIDTGILNQSGLKITSIKEINGHEYVKFDNYDAIDVPYTDAIPSDYNGIMGEIYHTYDP